MTPPEWSEPQQAIFHAMDDDSVDVIVAVGPVQSGKTHAATWAFMRWATEQFAGEDLLLAGRTQRQLHGAVMRRAQEFSDHVSAGWRRTREPWIMRSSIGPPNRYYQLIGSDAGAEAKARSYSAAGAFCDEGSLLPTEFLSSIQDRLSHPRAKLVITTNPAGPAHPLKTGLVDLAADDPSIRVINFRLIDNPALTENYIRRLSARYSGAQYRRMVLGEWAANEGLIWPDTVDHIGDQPDPESIQTWAVGVDWAHSSTTAAVLCGRGRDGRWWVCDEWHHDGVRDGQLSEVAQARRLAAWIGDRPVSTVWVDPTAVAFRRALRAELGAEAGAVVRTADAEVEPGVQYVRWLMDNDALSISRWAESLISEMLRYEWDDRFAGIGVDKPKKVNDHHCDALRYCLWSSTGRNNVGRPMLLKGSR